jgi:hypothetical protein
MHYPKGCFLRGTDGSKPSPSSSESMQTRSALVGLIQSHLLDPPQSLSQRPLIRSS